MSVADSRPPTPDSPSSLRDATATIDDLTLAVANFARVPSPEPPNVTVCCCERGDCESTGAWSALKAKLESRLVLSAEVGQALLERHEAYVRRHELDREPSPSRQSGEDRRNKRTEEEVDARVAELVRENALLEKRLSRALLNNEVSEVSHQNVLQELQQSKARLEHLTAYHARSIGLESRLSTALQDKDDLQQERDSATQRAKLAESRIMSLREKCSKLQAQVGRLRQDLEMQRSHRQELSEEILIDARQRLEQLQQVQLGHTTMADDAEVTKVLETLVADNEALKHDNAELQNLLAETREDLRTVQEEVDERRANDTFSFSQRSANATSTSVFQDSALSSFRIGTAPTPSVFHAMARSTRARSSDRRAASVDRGPRRVFEPLTPETDRRPLSPTDSVSANEARWASLSRPRSLYTPSHLSSEVEDDSQRHNYALSPERPRARQSISLLTRSRAVQTDGTGNTTALLDPSPVPRAFGDQFSSPPQDAHSDSSSLTDSSSVVGILVERLSQLMNRLAQADALTLTNRLKRQHLLGADVSHLSRTTVNAILTDVSTLRTHFRAFLEDDKVTTTCTRRDLRALFKLAKDMFVELGQLRVTLNDVILDPAVASKVSEMAMNPSKQQPSAARSPGVGTNASPSSTNGTQSSWMAPLSKFLGLPGSGTILEESAATRALSPPRSGTTGALGRPPTRVVPKREAALSASAMTVNVEFSGAGVGRAVTSTYSAHPERRGYLPLSAVSEGGAGANAASGSGGGGGTGATLATRSVMGIFAGAPRMADSTDPWIVVPKPQRGAFTQPGGHGSATVGRRSSMMNFHSAWMGGGGGGGDEAGAGANRKLSRVVDAMLDHPAQSGSSLSLSRSKSGDGRAGGLQSQKEEDEEIGEERDVVQDTLLDRTLRPRGLSDSSLRTTFLNHSDDVRSRKASAPSEQRPDADGETPRPDRGSVLRTLSKKMQSFRLASTSFASAAAPTVTTPSRPQTPTGKKTEQEQQINDKDKLSSSSPVPRASSPGMGLFPSLNLTSWAAAAALVDGDETGEPSSVTTRQVFYGSGSRDEAFMGRHWAGGRDL